MELPGVFGEAPHRALLYRSKEEGNPNALVLITESNRIYHNSGSETLTARGCAVW